MIDSQIKARPVLADQRLPAAEQTGLQLGQCPGPPPAQIGWLGYLYSTAEDLTVMAESRRK